MTVSTRAAWALGLGFAGLAIAVGPTLGQQQDAGVRKTTASAAAPKAAVPAVIGTVDLDAVFKGYDKVKADSEEFKSAAQVKKGELMKLQAEAQQEQEMLAKMAPGSPDAKKHEERITALKAQHQAGMESAEREFALKEAQALATLYQEIQVMVMRIAQHRGMTYVVKVSNEPITGANPNSVMAAMSKTVVYADPRNDVTNDVIYNLNLSYKKAGGVAPKAATAAPAPAANAPAGGN
jgi:Skp family chaperone for outer membrane proteins